MTATPVRPLAGASVLVVGATGGLGRALARELHRRGAVLTLSGRRADALGDLDVPGHRVLADLRDPEGCRTVVDAAVAHAGGLDVVVNATGVVAFGRVDELDVDVMEEVFLTNTFATIMLSQAALRVMNDGGAIVTISGVIAERNLPGMAVYGASKAAVRAFADATRREVRTRNIRLLDARPPHTETGLVDRALSGTAPRLPAGREPDDIARTICDAIESGVDELPSTSF